MNSSLACCVNELARRSSRRSGHALWELPVGFIRTEDHRIEKIADRQVQEAIEGVFRKFRELGSARQTTLWYASVIDLCRCCAAVRGRATRGFVREVAEDAGRWASLPSEVLPPALRGVLTGLESAAPAPPAYRLSLIHI